GRRSGAARACTQFLASAFYTTMGFAVPAALGAQIAQPNRRALVLVGAGAFQMTVPSYRRAAVLFLRLSLSC
ncbi:MAG TPA: thiamine pyrophosphate-dependent enzyme, partial [Gammaproteobacteria bacterium]|nr:thiamine pyrophosphate-dependent enzyme [Gammaproteobacteria bacterium]